MLEERKQIGVIASGDIAITNAYGLNAKKVIHAVTVAWTDGFHDELACVQKCYHKSLAAAADYMQNHSLLSISIAMPLIGTGIYQIPLESCMSIAIFESMQFSLTYNMDIYLVLFDESSVSAMKKAFPVEEYISYESSRDILKFEYTKHQSLESPESIHNSIKQTNYYLLEMQPKKFVDSLKDQFSTGNLEEKSLCISPDLPACELDPKSASIIKQLTGNDKVSVAVKYKNNAQFRFEGKLILASNYPLLTAKPDDAFMQRAIVVPFLHAVPKDVQDKNLLDHLKAEKPAIATKALDAYFQLRRNHYCFSGNYEINSSFLYPDDLLGDTDITPLVYNFLLKNFERDPASLVAIQSAYELFIQNTSTKVTEKMFSSVFHRLAMELFGANKTRSYHSGTYQNARSSIAGIRFK